MLHYSSHFQFEIPSLRAPCDDKEGFSMAFSRMSSSGAQISMDAEGREE